MRKDNIDRRLRRLETPHTFKGDIERASDAQLLVLIRDGYPDLIAQHGSLVQAVEALRQSGDADDAGLALIIEEDIKGPDARYQ